jgi:hypothetical protein
LSQIILTIFPFVECRSDLRAMSRAGRCAASWGQVEPTGASPLPRTEEKT